MAERNYGFIDWDSGHSSIIMSASLADASNLGGMSIVGTDAGTEVYEQGGIKISSSLGLNFTPTTAQKAQLVNGGHMSLHVEKKWLLDNWVASSGQESLMGIRSAIGLYIGIHKGNLGSLIRMRDTKAALFSPVNARIRDATKDDFVLVTFDWYGTTVLVRVDKLPVIKIEGAIIEDLSFATMFFGGINGTGALNNVVIKNVHISTLPIRLHVPYGMFHIAIAGHSYSEGMDYSEDATKTLIVGERTNGDSGDDRGLSNLHREFAKHGWDIPQGRIRNVGVGGTLLNTVLTGSANSNVVNQLVDTSTNLEQLGAQVGMICNNVTAGTSAVVTGVGTNNVTFDTDLFPLGTEAYSFTTGYEGQLDVLETYSSKLDILIMQMGTNEAASPIPATWQADYQVHIDRATALGARIIILINANTRNTNPDFAGDTYEARIDELNVIHKAIADANSNVYLVDAFTLFGGHNNWIDADVNQSSPTHPSDRGYAKILTRDRGIKGVADVLIPLIYAT